MSKVKSVPRTIAFIVVVISLALSPKMTQFPIFRTFSPIFYHINHIRSYIFSKISGEIYPWFDLLNHWYISTHFLTLTASFVTEVQPLEWWHYVMYVPMWLGEICSHKLWPMTGLQLFLPTCMENRKFFRMFFILDGVQPYIFRKL